MKKALLAAALLTGLAAAAFAATRAERQTLEKQLNLFVDILTLVQNEYVEDVRTDRLVSGALAGMLRSLDPYSQYLDKEAYEDLKVETEGAFGGVGLEISVKNGLLQVISPLDGSPAQRAGVKAGDTIISIDGIASRDISLGEAVKKMRGPSGTTVKLTILREGEKKFLDLAVRRAVIAVKSVKSPKIVAPGIGYVRVASFQEHTPDDFARALDQLDQEGAKGVILDFRNNAGGLLSAAVEIAKHFVPEGGLIVSTRGRNPEKETPFASQGKRMRRYHPFIVLVNKGSASGSEIFAAAVQDHKLGVVIGQKTYGKASVQTLIPLPDGTAIRLTTSHYYTPAGRLLHEKGVTPDRSVDGDFEPGKPDKQLDAAIALARELAGAAA